LEGKGREGKLELG